MKPKLILPYYWKLSEILKQKVKLLALNTIFRTPATLEKELSSNKNNKSPNIKKKEFIVKNAKSVMQFKYENREKFKNSSSWTLSVEKSRKLEENRFVNGEWPAVT